MCVCNFHVAIDELCKVLRASVRQDAIQILIINIIIKIRRPFTLQPRPGTSISNLDQTFNMAFIITPNASVSAACPDHDSVFQMAGDVQWNASCARSHYEAKLSAAHCCPVMAKCKCNIPLSPGNFAGVNGPQYSTQNQTQELHCA